MNSLSVLFVGLALNLCGSVIGHQNLYADSDLVVTVNATTLSGLVADADYISYMVFYRSDCGHCVVFSVHWKQLATDCISWQDNLKLGAIDCAIPENYKTCKDMNVQRYPSIQIFPPKYPEGKPGIPVVKHDFAIMKAKLVELILAIEPKPSHWPNTNDYQGTSITDIFNSGPPTANIAIIIVEQPKSQQNTLSLDLLLTTVILKEYIIVRRTTTLLPFLPKTTDDRPLIYVIVKDTNQVVNIPIKNIDPLTSDKVWLEIVNYLIVKKQLTPPNSGGGDCELHFDVDLKMSRRHR